MKRTITIYIVVVPWDYSTAEAVVFTTLKEAQDYKHNEVSEKAQHYTTISEQQIEV